MKRQAGIFGLTLLALLLMDAVVAVGLNSGLAPGAIERYFEYGRSVPGKLKRWIAQPDLPNNIFDTAWVPQQMEISRAAFISEDPTNEPVLRSYGMSFSANILNGALEADPSLRRDLHGGPAAPPNLAYETFLRDRDNRKPGDVVILSFLSSSVAAMASMSNRSWVFEQPAPLTYPIFLPDPDTPTGLTAVVPLIQSAAQERALQDDPDAARAWQAQLTQEDGFYTHAAFSLPTLDVSPFARLIRRALAVGAIDTRKAEIFADPTFYPYPDVLNRMIVNFAEMARADGQYPLVMLIQGRDPGDPDLWEITQDTLMNHDVPVLVTAQNFDVTDPRNFRQDGHYARTVDRHLGAVVVKQLRAAGALE